MLNRCSFAQRGASALGFDLGSELVLELFVLTDMQAPALADPRCGALRSLGTRITGTGGKLGVFAWDHWHGLATRTGDGPVRKIQGKVVLGEERPALRPGAGHDVHALGGPWGNPRARHRPQVEVQLEQARALLQLRRQQLYGLMLRLVGWTVKRG